MLRPNLPGPLGLRADAAQPVAQSRFELFCFVP